MPDVDRKRVSALALGALRPQDRQLANANTLPSEQAWLARMASLGASSPYQTHAQVETCILSKRPNHIAALLPLAGCCADAPHLNPPCGAGQPASFLFAGGCVQEINWYKQQYSSWFVGDRVLSGERSISRYHCCCLRHDALPRPFNELLSGIAGQG